MHWNHRSLKSPIYVHLHSATVRSGYCSVYPTLLLWISCFFHSPHNLDCISHLISRSLCSMYSCRPLTISTNFILHPVLTALSLTLVNLFKYRNITNFSWSYFPRICKWRTRCADSNNCRKQRFWDNSADSIWIHIWCMPFRGCTDPIFGDFQLRK